MASGDRHEKPCPNCGHCPTCGRSNFRPWNPYPWYWPYGGYRWYGQTPNYSPAVWSNTQSQMNSGASGVFKITNNCAN